MSRALHPSSFSLRAASCASFALGNASSERHVPLSSMDPPSSLVLRASPMLAARYACRLLTVFAAGRFPSGSGYPLFLSRAMTSACETSDQSCGRGCCGERDWVPVVEGAAAIAGKSMGGGE